MCGPAGRLALLALGALLPAAHAQLSQKLTDQIEHAVKAQKHGDAINVTSAEIAFAPVANLTAGTGDLDTAGKCKDDIKIFCNDVKPGYAHLAECIGSQIADDIEGTSEFTGKVSEECQEAVLLFKIKLADNINLDVKTAAACKFDAERFCNSTDELNFPGKVIACLRVNKPQLRGKCKARITALQMEVAEDYRLDAMLFDACRESAEEFCGDVKPGGGRINGCLRDHRAEITNWDCLEEMFQADLEGADDLRLNVRLFNACLPEKRKFCHDVPPGHSRAKDCLEEHKGDAGFGETCKQLLDKMIEARSQDFRLDYHLRTVCAKDIRALCDIEEKGLMNVASSEGRVTTCLQDMRLDIQEPACVAAVHQEIARASGDIRFATQLSHDCADDREKFCKNVEPGSARVIRCLQDAREKLSSGCSSTLFDMEVKMSESIDFNAPLAEACTAEVKTFCEDVPEGHARVMWCLQQHKDDGQFSKRCRDEVAQHEKSMSRDYRLNWRLSKQCDADAQELCTDACEDGQHHACGGKVLRCLMDNRSKLKHEACRTEVFYFIRMDVNSFGNDIILAEACRDDVSKLCSDVRAGQGRVHECLRKHRQKLSARCRKEEFRLEIEETSNVELKTTFMRACTEERSTFCEAVQTGGARVFRCLVANLGDADFGEACRRIIVRKLQRRQENWKLDAPLAAACAADAETHCNDVDHESDTAETTRCLMQHVDDVDESCQRELSRVAHMALLVWQPEGALSKPCDGDIKKLCHAKSMQLSPGSVLECLEKSLETKSKPGKRSAAVSEECKALVTLAEPPDEKKDFDNAFKRVAAQRMHQSLTRAGMWDKRQGVTITGYSALFCFSALVTTLLMGLRYAYKRWRGVDDSGYTRVMKQGDV